MEQLTGPMGGDEPFHETVEEVDLSGRRNDLIEQRDGRMTDAETGTFRTTFDSRTDSADMAIVSAVAAISNTDPKEMEPLHGVVDTDALNSIVRRGSDAQVTFPYTGYEVVVRSDGVITVAPDVGG